MSSPSSINRPTRVAAATLVAVLVLAGAACGGDKSSSSTAGGKDFCASLKAMQSKLSDGATASQQERLDLLDSLSKVTPPAAIADEWHTLVSTKDLISHPDQITEAQKTAITDAGEKVDKYVTDTCGLKL